MFIRVKRAGKYEYLQLVENRREGKRTRQRIVATLGRLDRLRPKDVVGCLQAKGQVDVLLRSLGRFAQRVEVQDAHTQGQLKALTTRRIGPALVFGRLWRELKIDRILSERLAGREFQFAVERAIFATVIHRLFESGSDRQGMRFLRDIDVPGSEELNLHQMYWVMTWLGEEKEEIEYPEDGHKEALFSANRDLFTELSLVFFDTTSFYFEGQGGEELGRYGHSKDHRPDLHQVVVGALLTQDGRPLSCTVSCSRGLSYQAEPGGLNDGGRAESKRALKRHLERIFGPSHHQMILPHGLTLYFPPTVCIIVCKGGC